jgi:hypothetical protein
VLIDEHVLPLRSRQIVANSILADIFFNIEQVRFTYQMCLPLLTACQTTQIRDVQLTFLADLERLCASQWPFVDAIGELFLKTLTSLRCYEVYIGNYRRALDVLHNARAATPKFDEFVREMHQAIDARGGGQVRGRRCIVQLSRCARATKGFFSWH